MENLEPQTQTSNEWYSIDTIIADVLADPVFGEYGRLLFPVNSRYYSGSTLGDLKLTWYNNIDPKKTVEIANYMKDHAEAGDPILFDFELSDGDMELIAALDTNSSAFFDHRDPAVIDMLAGLVRDV